MKPEVLKLLKKNSKLTPDTIAKMLGVTEDAVASAINELEEDKVIVGYHPIINWEKAGDEFVTAFIELKIAPQRSAGFDRVAERIYQYDEVNSLFLMSGGYDLLIEVRGRTIKDVSLFVSEKLAPMESVISTATHFMLKNYKYDGVIIDSQTDDDREVITL